MINKRAIIRFVQYSLIGGGTFLLDLSLLFIFIDVFAVHYLLAVSVAFLIAVSCNYVLSRKLVFVGSERSHKVAYMNFLLIAGAGLFFVTASMYVLVGLLSLSPILSRMLVASVTGVWNYLMNLFYNFKVAGN